VIFDFDWAGAHDVNRATVSSFVLQDLLGLFPFFFHCPPFLPFSNSPGGGSLCLSGLGKFRYRQGGAPTPVNFNHVASHTVVGIGAIVWADMCEFGRMCQEIPAYAHQRGNYHDSVMPGGTSRTVLFFCHLYSTYMSNIPTPEDQTHRKALNRTS